MSKSAINTFLMGTLLFLCAGFSFATVDLNSATQAELEKVNGLGPKKAQAIIEYRNKNHGFKNVDDLQNVHGIGHGKTFDKIKGEFTVSGKTASTAKVGPAMKAHIPNKGFHNPAQTPTPSVSNKNNAVK